MTVDDVVATLQHLGCLFILHDGSFAIKVNHDEISEYFRNFQAKGLATLEPQALRWTPDPANVVKLPDA